MHPITIAVADADRNRCVSYEYAFLQAASTVSLLTNIPSRNNFKGEDRRKKSRANITRAEDEVARAKRLKPNVLFVDIDLLPDPDCELLKTMRQECPETLVVLLTNEKENEDLIVKALEVGARGYLSREAVQQHISKVASVISKGEFWVPRHMLGKIMDRIQSRERHWQFANS